MGVFLVLGSLRLTRPYLRCAGRPRTSERAEKARRNAGMITWHEADQTSWAIVIHSAIHNNVVYGVLPRTCGAVRALPCR
jgi:hypothetical protein